MSPLCLEEEEEEKEGWMYTIDDNYTKHKLCYERFVEFISRE